MTSLDRILSELELLKEKKTAEYEKALENHDYHEAGSLFSERKGIFDAYMIAFEVAKREEIREGEADCTRAKEASDGTD